MQYAGRVSGADAELAIEREGLRLGSRFLDFADVKTLRPVNHRVQICTLSGEEIEISMLGFSFDGFWEELMTCFSDRSLEALFVEEKELMRTEGDYQTPLESGRAKIALYGDAVCILPQTMNAVRIPLCFAREIRLDGYRLTISLETGAEYTVARMGYDTKPFAERAHAASALVKKERAAAQAKLRAEAPFTETGLFRTHTPDRYWLAAFGKGVCAVELNTGDDAATYLYRFPETEQVFLRQLELAMEAMGPHREIIYWTDEQLGGKPLYRMAVQRCAAVTFLRDRAAGRLIHSANHAERLRSFLEQA